MHLIHILSLKNYCKSPNNPPTIFILSPYPIFLVSKSEKGEKLAPPHTSHFGKIGQPPPHPPLINMYFCCFLGEEIMISYILFNFLIFKKLWKYFEIFRIVIYFIFKTKLHYSFYE